MSFGDAVHSVLSKYVCFTGRARRSEYWYFILFEMIVSAALTGVLSFIGARESTVEVNLPFTLLNATCRVRMSLRRWMATLSR